MGLLESYKEIQKEKSHDLRLKYQIIITEVDGNIIQRVGPLTAEELQLPPYNILLKNQF